MSFRFLSSLRAKILWPLAIVMISVGLLSALQFRRHLDQALLDEFASKGRALARSLASSAQDTLLTRDASTVQGFIDEYKGIHGVGYVYVTDGKGAVIAHTFSPAFPDEILHYQATSLEVSKTSQTELLWRGRRYLDIRAPILAGTLGNAHVGMDLGLAEDAGRVAIRNVLFTVLLLSLAGFGCIFLLLNRSIRQIIHLSSLSRRISEGNLDIKEGQVSRREFGGDEIGVLATNFFKMISELKYQRENLEEAVHERTKRLSETNERLELESRYVNILQKSAIAANEAETPTEALRSALHIVSTVMGYALGHVFLCKDGPSGPELESTGIWYRELVGDATDFVRASNGAHFPSGVGLPGMALKSARVSVLAVTSVDQAMPRRTEAKALGLRSGIAVPVMIDGRVVAVMEFISRDVITMEAAFESVMTNVGIQVGRVFERTQAREVFEDQRAKLVAASKMSSLGEMAGGVAHEINNPLAIIKSLGSQIVELLDDDPIEKNLLTERAAKLSKAADRIAKIVQGLRTFSRDGSGDPFQNVIVHTLVEETLSFCRERLQKNGVDLIVDPIPADLVFEGRATQISQVLVNLLHNADDAISKVPKRWIRVTAADAGVYVEIRISDCGGGLAPEVQKKLFQPFFTTKEIGKGTGMGLSISLGILKSHQGELVLDNSSPNTCFVILLPKKQRAKAAA